MISLNAMIATLLDKAAVDNGFDQELPRQGAWLGFASTQAPVRIWLTALGDGPFVLAASQVNVARAMSEHGTASFMPLPAGALGARSLADMPAVHRAVRRAFQLSKTLPDELLHEFEARTSRLPRSTEVERLVVQRVGQDLFRAGLLDFWEGRCAITGLAVPELLRASHIKPWADCEMDAERLDVFNGLLLAPHLDALFDRGFLTVEDDGVVVLSHALEPNAIDLMGAARPMRVRYLVDGHRQYLLWHRSRIWRR